MARSWVGLTILACLPCIVPPRSPWSLYSYGNKSYKQDCYECAIMSSKNSCLTRLPPVLHHKEQFAYESSVPTAVRADSYAEYKTKIHYRVFDCFVARSARALSLFVSPSPRSVGT